MKLNPNSKLKDKKKFITFRKVMCKLFFKWMEIGKLEKIVLYLLVVKEKVNAIRNDIERIVINGSTADIGKKYFERLWIKIIHSTR